MGHMIAWLHFTACSQSTVHHNMREHSGLLSPWQEKAFIEVLCVRSLLLNIHICFKTAGSSSLSLGWGGGVSSLLKAPLKDLFFFFCFDCFLKMACDTHIHTH